MNLNAAYTSHFYTIFLLCREILEFTHALFICQDLESWNRDIYHFMGNHNFMKMCTHKFVKQAFCKMDTHARYP